jgi:hypothetical protein
MRRLLCLLTVIAGCGILDPGDACGCTPELFTMPLAGDVLDSSDEPVSGVLVVTESAPSVGVAGSPPCAQHGATIARTETMSDANGEFSTVARWPGWTACARVWAQRQRNGQTLSSDTLVLALDLKSSYLPVDLILRLREPAAP